MNEAAAPSSRFYVLALGALVALVAAVATWNASSLPTVVGYDAEAHHEYVRSLLDEHRPPGRESHGAFWKPPGYFVVAAVAVKVGQLAGMDDANRAGQYVNVVFVVAAALFVLAAARLLWPARPVLHFGALAFLALFPAVLRMAATFHPATLAVLLSAAALYMTVRIILRPPVRPARAAGLGVLLVAGVLVMPHMVATFAGVLGAFAAVAVIRPERRRELLKAVGVVAAVTVAVASPWLIRQTVLYSNPIASGPLPPASRLLDTRPPSFYLGVGVPEIAERPFRDSYKDQLLPVAYSELWGDYFGVFAWHDGSPMTSAVERDLRWQMAVGALPTLLAMAGWLAMAGLLLRRGEVKPTAAAAVVVLLPLVAFLVLVAYATAYPAGDADTSKGTFMLVAAPAWALAFGFALSTLGRGRAAKALVVVLVVAALVNLRFVVHGSHLGGLL